MKLVAQKQEKQIPLPGDFVHHGQGRGVAFRRLAAQAFFVQEVMAVEHHRRDNFKVRFSPGFPQGIVEFNGRAYLIAPKMSF
ncbi:MAG: hypothetical protein ACREDN_05200 [Aestuariivirga sp.]